MTPRPEADGETRTLRVFRFKRGDGGGRRYDTFTVPLEPRTTVLDALLWIRRRRDPTLCLRHSCLHASCGTCGMLVDGREALACVTRLSDLGSRVTVEPLANLPVVSDLVVDARALYARFGEVVPLLRQSELAADPGFVRYEDCIECGLCLSACPVVTTSHGYVGPAALAAVQRLLEEPRGADLGRLLDWADREDGVWRCHAAFECTRACPAGVDPAWRLMALRGALLHRQEPGKAA